MLLNTFSLYNAIIYKKNLEKENKTTDFKWENLKKIVICRLLHFGEEFYNNKFVTINTGLISGDYCLFEVHTSYNNKEYLFFINKNNDNLLLISIKHSDKKVEKFYGKNYGKNYRKTR